jgi:(2Fe-2S) ferredoxin
VLRWRRTAALAVASLLSVGLTACSKDRPTQTATSTTTTAGGATVVTTAGDEFSSPNTSGPATSATSATTAAVPRAIVASTTAETLVVLDPDTGAVRRTLAAIQGNPTDCNTEGGCQAIGTMVVSPDGKTVYYEEVGEPVSGIINRVPLAGGPIEQVTMGSYPTLSPDGQRLAYLLPTPAIVIRTLSTGAEQTIEAGGDEYVQMDHLAWSPSGDRLAVEITENGKASTVALVRLNTDKTVRAAPKVSPTTIPGGTPQTILGVPTWRGTTGELIVVSQCCFPEPGERSQLVRLQADGQRSLGATPIETSVWDLAYDRTGQARLLVGLDDYLSVATAGQVRRLPGSYVAAAWA